MPVYRSKLFQRNNGGMSRATTYRKKPYPKRSPRTYNRAAPAPAKSLLSHVNTAEQKVSTGYSATIALKDVGQCFHLDQITQGPGATQRLGQRYRVTGFHLRGHWDMASGVSFDNVGFNLIWDRQPNEILANPADILNSGVSSIDSFSNQDNLGRFIFLGRVTHKADNALINGTEGLQTRTESASWAPDEFFDLSDKRLITTQVLSGDGLIGDRTSGALLLLGLGHNAAASSENLKFNFRVFFEDV